MSTRQLYDQWSATYDAVENKTRDLEKLAAQQVLKNLCADSIIEIGCGTGKNTEWLADKATHLTAVDFSESMLALARKKVSKNNVAFQLADASKPWTFTDRKADLITCSLILEHVADLGVIFREAKDHLKEGGCFYVCELHPFKQYSGSKARFETAAGTQVLDCYTHHVTDYIQAAAANQLQLADLREWFDDDQKDTLPRLISFLFSKKG